MPTDIVDDGSGTTVLDVLRQKHPSAQPPGASSLVPSDDLRLFEDVEITGSHLLFVAHCIQGVLDQVVVMLVTGEMYCFGLALIAPDFMMLCCPCSPTFEFNCYINALVANHLIVLDKCPGVHPIGIRETLRRVIGKAVCYATRVDVELACGSNQLCGSVKSGIECAIHAMTSLFLQHGATSS